MIPSPNKADLRIAKLTQDLESVLTIDGRGRSKKAQLLLQLFEDHEWGDVLAEIRRIGERKVF
jgi:hypothetical protein